MSILDHPILNQRYFFPRPVSPDHPFRVEASGFELRCHRIAGDPMLVHFHGNGEVVSSWVSSIAHPLSMHGIGSLLGEYRGYGGSSGSPALVSMLDDSLAVVDAAGVPPERIVLYGRSVGSIYALHAAAHRRVAGLIIESGIADVGDDLGVRPEEIGSTAAEIEESVSKHFDHCSKIRDFGGPVLILHTACDHIVPVRDAYRLAEWAGERATLRVFEDGDHNSIFAIHGGAIVDATIEFIRTCTGTG
jgi:alpha-beta hydrolase superfamily lysophospholipase